MNLISTLKKQLLLLTTVFSLGAFATTAYAGDKIGNGGGLWACQNAQADLISGTLLDLFEATQEFGYPIMTTTLTDPYQISDSVLNKYRQEWPEFAAKIASHMAAVLSNKHFVDAVVEKIDDAKPPISPLPNQCHGGVWNFVQFANYKDDGQLLIRNDLWNSSALGAIDKAALLWHEAVYRWLRTDYQDDNSIRSRKIVGLVFSTLSTDEISLEVRKVVWGTSSSSPAPTPAPSPRPNPMPTPGAELPEGKFICVIDENMRNTPYMVVSDSEFDASTRAEMACKNGPMSNFCSDASLNCEPLTAKITWQCKTTNHYSGHLFIGRGRAQLEAKYNAQIACLAQSSGSEFACANRSMMDCVAL